LQEVSDAVTRVHDFLTLSTLEHSPQGTSIFEGMDYDDGPTKFPCIQIPPPRQYFHGREEHLDAITAHLNNSSELGQIHSFAIYGMGGVGKTAVALKFAHMCKNGNLYDAIFWIHCETILALKQSFTDIARSLNLSQPTQSDDHDTNILAVKNWLQKTRK
jgi:Cdc6-like AAA superfamily ATPase